MPPRRRQRRPLRRLPSARARRSPARRRRRSGALPGAPMVHCRRKRRGSRCRCERRQAAGTARAEEKWLPPMSARGAVAAARRRGISATWHPRASKERRRTLPSFDYDTLYQVRRAPPKFKKKQRLLWNTCNAGYRAAASDTFRYGRVGRVTCAHRWL